MQLSGCSGSVALQPRQQRLLEPEHAGGLCGLDAVADDGTAVDVAKKTRTDIAVGERRHAAAGSAFLIFVLWMWT